MVGKLVMYWLLKMMAIKMFSLDNLELRNMHSEFPGGKKKEKEKKKIQPTTIKQFTQPSLSTKYV